MKTARKALIVALCLIMLASLSVPAFAASGGKVKQYSDYCCIGDSVATGWGVVNLDYSNSWGNGKIQAHYGDAAPGAFTKYIQDAVGARYHSMTCVGQRIVDVLWTLGDFEEEYDYEEAYEYHYNHQASPTRWAAIELMHDTGEAQNRVRESGLITLYIGSNDLLTYPKFSSTYSDGFHKDEFIQKIVVGYERFMQYYPRLIERIRELNPFAKIVVMGMMNPYSNIRLNEDDDLFLVGKALSLYTDSANVWLKTLCQYFGCTYVDITEVGKSFPEFNFEDENAMTQIFNMEFHPSQAQHVYMADQVINALPKGNTELLSPRSGLIDLDLAGKDAGNYTFRGSAIAGWTINDTTGNYVCYDKSTNSIVLRDSNPTKWFFNGGLYATSIQRDPDAGLFSFVNSVFKTTAKVFKINLLAFLPRLTLRYLDFTDGALVASSVKVDADMYRLG